MKKKSTVFVISILMIYLFIVSVSAEKIEINIENNYAPGEDINFKIILYDDNLNIMDGKVDFQILDFFSSVVQEGKADSGKFVIFKLPENAERGPWAVRANYNDASAERLFNVGELEKAEIKLEGDNLVITNVGNVPYEKPILIYIGEHHETALVSLVIGQTKRIRLTAPPGEYTIKVNDGTEDNIFEATGVTLTGNVVGIESVIERGFWKRYPLVSLFLIVLGGAVLAVFVLKIRKKISK